LDNQFSSSPAKRERKGAHFAKQSGIGEGPHASRRPSSPPSLRDGSPSSPVSREKTKWKNKVFTAMTLLMFPSYSHACECEWRQYNSESDSLIYEVSKVEIVFEGIPLSFKLITNQDEDPYAELILKVTRCVKGSCPLKVLVRSWGGDTGANCGMAESLNVPISSKQHYWVGGNYDHTKPTYKHLKAVSINSCQGLFKESEPTGHLP
jgi:hypothetical protein